MIKRVIKETVNEYDGNGNLVRQTITETTEDDDTQYWQSVPPQRFWWNQGPMCECSADNQGQWRA